LYIGVICIIDGSSAVISLILRILGTRNFYIALIIVNQVFVLDGLSALYVRVLDWGTFGVYVSWFTACGIKIGTGLMIILTFDWKRVVAFSRLKQPDADLIRAEYYGGRDSPRKHSRTGMSRHRPSGEGRDEDGGTEGKGLEQNLI
jgi:hypothetical protein